jgi:hypothetical protein
MAGTRQRYSKERHTRLKAGCAAVSVAGFLVGWWGLAVSHDPVASADATPPAASMPTAVLPTSTPGTLPPGATATPTPAAAASTPEPRPTQRARTSRGSR